MVLLIQRKPKVMMMREFLGMFLLIGLTSVNAAARSALLLALLALVPSSTTYAQSTIADTPASSATSDVSLVSPPHRYGELSFYTAQTFDNPQIISYLSGEHLFLTGVRLTSRLFTTPHLFIGGNLDLKLLAIYSRNIPNCRPNTYAGCGSIGDTYGGGGSVGLQFAPRNSWRWQPFFDVDGGLLAFTHDVPLYGCVSPKSHPRRKWRDSTCALD